MPLYLPPITALTLGSPPSMISLPRNKPIVAAKYILCERLSTAMYIWGMAHSAMVPEPAISVYSPFLLCFRQTADRH